MISLELARRMRAAGLSWTPARGDRFAIPRPDLRDEVFILSDMTIEVHDFPTGQVIGFNGTTEWALDSIMQEDAVWLPREDQLRDLLGAAFARLERDGDDYSVHIRDGDGAVSYSSSNPAEAYGQALLHLLVTRASADR